jgi:hypothetical protein
MLEIMFVETKGLNVDFHHQIRAVTPMIWAGRSVSEPFKAETWLYGSQCAGMTIR